MSTPRPAAYHKRSELCLRFHGTAYMLNRQLSLCMCLQPAEHMNALWASTMSHCEMTCILFPSTRCKCSSQSASAECWVAHSARIRSRTEAYVRMPTSRTGNTPVVTTRLTSSWIGDAGCVLGIDSLATRAAHALGLSWAGCVTSTCACLALSFVGSSLCAARLAGDDCIGPQALVARPRHCEDAQSGHEHVCCADGISRTYIHH
jgi:hypothetical protein